MAATSLYFPILLAQFSFFFIYLSICLPVYPVLKNEPSDQHLFGEASKKIEKVTPVLKDQFQIKKHFSGGEYNIPASTVSFKELSANLRTALAAFSGTGTTSELSLAGFVDSSGDIEVSGTERRLNAAMHISPTFFGDRLYGTSRKQMEGTSEPSHMQFSNDEALTPLPPPANQYRIML